MNAIALTFQDTPFTVIDRNQQPWLKQSEIACALYGVKKGGGQSDAPFENAEKSLKRLYARNADEFTDSMTALVEMETNGGKQQVRIFSLRGCHLLAMFARTAVAKEFRKWVLDILEHHTQPRYGLLDLPEPYTITKSQAGELYTIVSNKAASSGKPRAYYWSRYQNHFKLASYKDTPADKFDEAKAYLLSLEGDADLLHVTPLELDALVDQRVKKVLEGEWLSHAKPESPQTDENGVTLFFPKLKNNRQRRWLVQQPRDEMVMYWALDDDQEVMSWQDFRKKIAYEPTELQALLEQLPIDLLPGVMNTTVRRLMACVR